MIAAHFPLRQVSRAGCAGERRHLERRPRRQRGRAGAAERGCRRRFSPVNLDELETWAIREALKKTKGNITRSANLLGVVRDTLASKIAHGAKGTCLASRPVGGSFWFSLRSSANLELVRQALGGGGRGGVYMGRNAIHRGQIVSDAMKERDLLEDTGLRRTPRCAWDRQSITFGGPVTGPSSKSPCSSTRIESLGRDRAIRPRRDRQISFAGGPASTLTARKAGIFLANHALRMAQ